MKFNIEVELDYIDEEGCLDDAIKDSILKSVTQVVMKKVSEQVDAKLDEIIIKAATDKANQIVNEITEDFTTKAFTKIDKYGDEIETDVTVKKILKKKFDDFWTARVDKGGSDSGYNNKVMSRVEWKIDELIRDHSAQFAKTLTTDTENKIKATMKKNLQASIGAKLVSELGFDKLLLEHKEE